LYAFEEIFSIRQCDGELCGENSMHAQTREASMTAAAATPFQQRVVSKECSLNDACMIWHYRQLQQTNISLSLALFLLACPSTDSPTDDDTFQKQFHAETMSQIDPRKIVPCKAIHHCSTLRGI
jgi:hypothetical protein